MSRSLKLRYDFNTADCVEIEFKPTQWTRVTPREFRSWLGPRRINSNPYKGPVYYEGTNFRYKPLKDDKNRIIRIDELNDLKLINKYKVRTLDMEPYVVKRQY